MMKNAFSRSWLFACVLMLGLAGCAGTGEKTGAYVDDSWITTKVKSDMIAAKDVHSSHIHVTTTKGVVALTGTVPTAKESDRAAEIARGVSGVKGVENDIRVQ